MKTKELISRRYRIEKMLTHTELKIQSSLRKYHIQDDNNKKNELQHSISLACCFAKMRQQ